MITKRTTAPTSPAIVRDDITTKILEMLMSTVGPSFSSSNSLTFGKLQCSPTAVTRYYPSPVHTNVFANKQIITCLSSNSLTEHLLTVSGLPVIADSSVATPYPLTRIPSAGISIPL
jgi:hypothetical protein